MTMIITLVLFWLSLIAFWTQTIFPSSKVTKDFTWWWKYEQRLHHKAIYGLTVWNVTIWCWARWPPGDHRGLTPQTPHWAAHGGVRTILIARTQAQAHGGVRTWHKDGVRIIRTRKVKKKEENVKIFKKYEWQFGGTKCKQLQLMVSTILKCQNQIPLLSLFWLFKCQTFDVSVLNPQIPNSFAVFVLTPKMPLMSQF